MAREATAVPSAGSEVCVHASESVSGEAAPEGPIRSTAMETFRDRSVTPRAACPSQTRRVSHVTAAMSPDRLEPGRETPATDRQAFAANLGGHWELPA